MKPIDDDMVEVCLTGLEVYVNDVLVEDVEELEKALKGAPTVLNSGTSRDDLEVE
jgi:hypothetical protein